MKSHFPVSVFTLTYISQNYRNVRLKFMVDQLGFSVICSSSSFWSLIVTTIQINSDSPGCINYPGWLSPASAAGQWSLISHGAQDVLHQRTDSGWTFLASSNGHKNVMWAKELWYLHTKLALWLWLGDLRKLVGTMLLPRRKGGVIGGLQVTPSIHRPWSLRHCWAVACD